MKPIIFLKEVLPQNPTLANISGPQLGQLVASTLEEEYVSPLSAIKVGLQMARKKMEEVGLDTTPLDRAIEAEERLADKIDNMRNSMSQNPNEPLKLEPRYDKTPMGRLILDVHSKVAIKKAT